MSEVCAADRQRRDPMPEVCLGGGRHGSTVRLRTRSARGTDNDPWNALSFGLFVTLGGLTYLVSGGCTPIAVMVGVVAGIAPLLGMAFEG